MSNFETWWEREGQEFLYALNTTTDDDIKLVAEIAWKNGAYCAEQTEQEPVLYPVRRGSRITCVESGEKCVVWTTSDTHAWVQFPDGLIGQYTYEQIGALFSLDDNYATDEAYERGLKEGIEAGKKIAAFEAKQEPVVDSIKIGAIPPFPLHTSTVQQVDLTDDEIEKALVYRTIGWTANARAVIAADREKNK